jgi:hypothetical protein
MQSAVHRPGVKGNAFFVGDYSAAYLGKGVGSYDHTDPFSVDLWIYPNEVYPEASVFLNSNHERHGNKGYNLYLKGNRLRFLMAHAWPYDNLEVISDEALPAKQWSHITLTYSGSGKAEGVHLYLNGRRLQVDVLQDNLVRNVRVDEKTSFFVFVYRGFALGVRTPVKHMKGGGLDELRVFDRELTDLEVLSLHDPSAAAKVAASVDASTSQAQLRDFAVDRQPAVAEAKSRLRESRIALLNLLDSVPDLMVMGDVPGGRQAYILKRGVFSEHGEAVEPTALESVLPFDANAPRNRLGLAQWLFDKDHPLTARVFVNRLWQMHFGRGLVETAADFGAQGTPPSHPELLDWLAVTFMESGWDIKAMQKLIVMSSTYRQSSTMSPAALQADPNNVWLARGPRFRLSAEMIRDNALAVSGLLVEKLGGESQFPYQPKGYAESSPGVRVKYPAPEEVGEGLYRRSLYTQWKRSAPPPFMMIFDKTEADVCTVTRAATSSPLQALALLNDTQFVEASRVLAQNVARGTPDSKERVRRVFHAFVHREPDAMELANLKSWYETELARFTATPEDARAYLKVGVAPFDESLDAPATAALAVISSVVMNTPEAYTRP